MTERPVYTSPTVTRSLLVLEMAGSLYAIRGGPTDRRRCGCRARWRSAAGRPCCMAAMGLAPSSRSRSGSSTSPSSTRRGHSPSHSAAARPSTSRFHSAPSPVPSLDQLGLALAAHTGITSLSELRERRYPLRIAIRGGRSDHCLHMILDHVLEAAGLSLAAIKAWGGEVHYDRYPPNVSGVEHGERDAVFDEALDVWAPKAIDLGMRFLAFDEPILQRLEALGYRRPPCRHPTTRDWAMTCRRSTSAGGPPTPMPTRPTTWWRAFAARSKGAVTEFPGRVRARCPSIACAPTRPRRLSPFLCIQRRTATGARGYL